MGRGMTLAWDQRSRVWEGVLLSSLLMLLPLCPDGASGWLVGLPLAPALLALEYLPTVAGLLSPLLRSSFPFLPFSSTITLSFFPSLTFLFLLPFFSPSRAVAPFLSFLLCWFASSLLLPNSSSARNSAGCRGMAEGIAFDIPDVTFPIPYRESLPPASRRP